MTDDPLVPPADLIFDGSTSPAKFKSIGEGFTRHFLLEHAKLKPHEKVLDVGCGIGQKARPLTTYLSEHGSYDGFDIVALGIDWCAEKYKPYPNFRFQLADVYSAHYNPRGTYKASDYKFPYGDNTFDLVLLSSVFTHMLPQDMENYFAELGRVLRPAGRCVITFFLLNPESRNRINLGLNTIKIPFVYQTEACYVASLASLETTVAHDEAYVRSLYEKNGLSLTEVTYGSWCGRQEFLGCLQDVLIAMKT